VLLQVPAVEDPHFIADVSYSAEGTVLRFNGTADSAVALELAAALAHVHHELRARRIRELVVDLRAVDSMIAACFVELVAWVERVQELGAEDGYRIRLRVNPAIVWQQHSLPALACFATDLVTLEG